MDDTNQRRMLLASGIGIFIMLLLAIGTGHTDSPPEPVDGFIEMQSPFSDAPQYAEGFDHRTTRSVGAFDCGSRNYISSVEEGRPFTVLAEENEGFIRVDMMESGEVCVKAVELIP